MKPNLKFVSLVVFVAFAMSAVAASAASAEIDHITSTAADEVTHLTAEATTPQDFYLDTEELDELGEEADRFRCEEVNLDGAIEGNTVDEVTVTPTYGQEDDDCVAFQNGTPIATTITSNECRYRFTSKTTETVTPGEHATVHLAECDPETPSIDIDVTTFTLACIAVPEQTLHGIRYSNDEQNENAIELEATVHGIESQTTGVCGEEEHKDGVYTGNVTVTGWDDAAHTKQVDLSVVTSETTE